MEPLSTRDLENIDTRVEQILSILDKYKNPSQEISALKDDILHAGNFFREILRRGYSVRYAIDEFYARMPELKSGNALFEKIVLDGVEEFVLCFVA